MKKAKTLKKHHAKPFRKRHVGLSLIGLGLVVAAAYMIGFGARQFSNSFNGQTVEANVPETSLQVIRSSLGFSFSLDKNTFDVTAAVVDNGEVREVGTAELTKSVPVTSVVITPNLQNISPIYGASRLNMRLLDSNSSLSTKLANKNADQTIEQVVADYFAPNNTTQVAVTQMSSSQVEISGLTLSRRVYQLATDLGGDLGVSQTYLVDWSGLVNNRPFNMQLSGLVGGSNIPSFYQPIFDSIAFDISVAAAINSQLRPVKSGIPGFASASAEAAPQLNEKYLADLVSPSVVKIYAAVCGEILVDDQLIDTGTLCDGGTGTGFIVSEDGYIATNGHVVVSEPVDLFANLLLSDSNILAAYLYGAGLSNAQIAAVLSSSDLVATVIADIYSEADLFSLKNEERRIMVALADEPVDMSSAEAFLSQSETNTIVDAKLVAEDYEAKDLYATVSIDQADFTASDVAIIKADLQKAPALELATTEPSQNESIVVLGYPGDAENSLVDGNKLAITVTNGVISSIREAKGSSSKLYQSDADASQGNSGGPAINADGQVIGLLTYRFQDEVSINASKSYIRDIADMISLADENSVSFTKESGTYDIWRQGLTYYSQDHFSKAIKEFDKVAENYPAHRLVDSYIEKSQIAIDEGRDVTDFPLLMTAAIGGGGSGLLGAGVFLFLRHNRNHKQHLVNSATNSGIAAGTPPVNPSAPAVTTPTQQPTSLAQMVTPQPVTPQVIVPGGVSSSTSTQIQPQPTPQTTVNSQPVTVITPTEPPRS
ncbi:trypsin-like peptidase domain-containing protein [Candidatus Saccharibacteria bacterium]|nr:trypsin-like peptidase domain-containing protein [Candidatus Saccharibacteria bacterium]